MARRRPILPRWLTRPRRRIAAVLLVLLVVGGTGYVMGWQRSRLRYSDLLDGWPPARDAELSWYTHGATRWLTVHRKVTTAPGGGSDVRRRLIVNPSGLMLAVVGIGSSVLGAVWIGRRLVAARVPGEVCDACGYSLRGSRSGVCPECGEGR